MQDIWKKKITTALSKNTSHRKWDLLQRRSSFPFVEIIRYRKNMMFFCFALRGNDIHSSLSLFVFCKGSDVSKVLLAFGRDGSLMGRNS